MVDFSTPVRMSCAFFEEHYDESKANVFGRIFFICVSILFCALNYFLLIFLCGDLQNFREFSLVHAVHCNLEKM